MFMLCGHWVGWGVVPLFLFICIHLAGTVPIPSDANVYYALSSASETKNEVIRATLQLVKRL